MSYIIIIFIIGILILIHELGHFIAGRLMGIPIERFSLGFGPKLFGFRRNGVDYWVSVIPLGGYVMPSIKEEDDFFKIPIYKRILFSIGGPVANILLTIILFSILDIAVAGFSLTNLLVTPFIQTFDFFIDSVSTIPMMFADHQQLSSIIGIVVEGGQVVGNNVLRGIYFGIFLSLNLAILNLLPLPPLDGGRILLYLLEKIHPKLMKLHLPISITGWVILIGFMMYTTVLDIGRYLIGKIG